MAQIKLDLFGPPADGMEVKFKAPCDCTQVDGLLVTFPDGEQTFTFRDSHGNNLAGIGHLFAAGAYVKVILDTQQGHAYLQNADNNAFLNAGIFGTYTQNDINLTGSGENGKFKATESGTFGSFNVNDEWKQVKCGEESSVDLIAGCWYTFILDGDTVNFNKGGAGGGGLNFKVVGGTTEPVSPSENTIWVNTYTPITGYEFSATEPAELVEGLVWITVGTSSTVEFNALKKISVMVYPISAKQYVSGAWVSVEAKTYQNGEWVDWVWYLYNMGDQFVDITGGWTARAWGESSSQSIAAPTVTMNDANMVITQMRMSGRDSGYGATIPAFDIDLTNFNTIVLDIVSLTTSGTGTRSWGVFLFAAERSAGGWGGTAIDAYYTSTAETKANFSLTLDVSALSGLWCVGIGTSAYSTNQNAVTTVTVKSVRCYP